MATTWAPTTRDTNAAKRARVRAYLKRPEAREKSNRWIARQLGVDEAMVRDWRKKMRVPKLRPGSGKPYRVRTARTKS